MMSERPAQPQIALAVELMRRGQGKDDRGLFYDLVSAGLTRELAARLVEFLPMAYCRVLLAGSGVQFSNSFRRSSRTWTLAADPTWLAVYEYAQTDATRGLERSEMLAIAGRSAELHAINQLLNDGSTLADLRLTDPILAWSDSGPDD